MPPNHAEIAEPWTKHIGNKTIWFNGKWFAVNM